MTELTQGRARIEDYTSPLRVAGTAAGGGNAHPVEVREAGS